jgi:hypothetical protein
MTSADLSARGVTSGRVALLTALTCIVAGGHPDHASVIGSHDDVTGTVDAKGRQHTRYRLQTLSLS